MSYCYKYLGDDQDLVVESDEPRPDLLEWAYWAEVPAPVVKPEPRPEAESEPVKPARKPRAAKAAEVE
ncbi:hypothetical protein [Nocardia xishanensis]|uniref:hypothetical protein n=1 Tax=Nocardia xishanensis TaxID=238964 RepID=UPI00082B94A0|nr:hypothetical protein [Nocardia xishanensis]